MAPSTVVWITGLAGSGKTTLAGLVCAGLRARGDSAVLLDGDALRDALGGVFGHERDERARAAFAYARLCRLVSDSGPHVVCATISMFHAVREWNRAHLPRYLEVWLQAPVPVLAARHPRRVYDGPGVVGVDVEAEEPLRPDLTLDASGAVPPEELARRVLAHRMLSSA